MDPTELHVDISFFSPEADSVFSKDPLNKHGIGRNFGDMPPLKDKETYAGASVACCQSLGRKALM